MLQHLTPHHWKKANAGTDTSACLIARGKCERLKTYFGQVNGRIKMRKRASRYNYLPHAKKGTIQIEIFVVNLAE